MKRNQKSLMAILTALFFLTVLVAPVICAAEDMKITGMLSDEGKILTGDGEEYTLADNDKKDELMENAGQKVSVMGAVTESEDGKTIAVKSYKVMEAEQEKEEKGGD